MGSRRLPWSTLSLAGVAIAAYALPGVSEAWQYDRVAIGQGEWWRLITGHLTHWNADHLQWDLLVFVMLGSLAETTSRCRQFVVLLVGSMLAISAGLWWWDPELVVYRGLSGVDSALFAWLAVRFWVEKWRVADWAPVVGVTLLVAGFVAKTAYEAKFSATLFVDSTEACFSPVPLAHLLGSGVGVASVLVEVLGRQMGGRRATREESTSLNPQAARSPSVR